MTPGPASISADRDPEPGMNPACRVAAARILPMSSLPRGGSGVGEVNDAAAVGFRSGELEFGRRAAVGE